MKSKIKFNQPKFVIPLLIFPFLLIGFYFFGSFAESNEPVSDLEEKAEINTSIPEVLNIKEEPNKLEAFKEALSRKRTNSGVAEIEEEEQKRILDEEEAETNNLIKRDSIKQIMLQANTARSTALSKQKTARQKLKEQALARINEGSRPKANRSSGSTNTRMSSRNQDDFNFQNGKPKTAEQREMEAFKKQMTFIDSMANPEKYAAKQAAIDKKLRDSLSGVQGQKETFKISKTRDSNDDFFNTIKANNDETFVSAIMDEGIKVYKGSRVRVRLMDDVFINDNLFPKGHYLFGIVEGFNAQRVLISVTSVILNDQIIPVNISLYDNDGMAGVYVPNTMFKQFAQELGVQTANNANSADPGDGESNMMFDAISSAVQSSTKAIQKALKSNKVRIKYNHKIYLVNNDN